MAGTTEFDIGAVVRSADGDEVGAVTRVVIEPIGGSLSHLVVKPRSWTGVGRLVPIGLVAEPGAEVQLRCPASEFEKLEEAEETHFLVGDENKLGYDPAFALHWPHYAVTDIMGMNGVVADTSPTVTFERVPVGEVAVRRGQHVRALDGEIGRVQGLLVDPADCHVTHVLLQEGHLWGRKQVAIPIGSVRSAGDGISVDLSKREIQALPAVGGEPAAR